MSHSYEIGTLSPKSSACVRSWEQPHGKLTDAQLEQAVLQAERKRAEHLAAAERARVKLAETEPAVAEGRGPAVNQLDTTLARLRRQLGL